MLTSPHCSRQLWLSTTSLSWVTDFSPFCLQSHPPWTWFLSPQTFENSSLACYLHFITLNACLTLICVDCVIWHLWLYTLGLGERREELIWLCHGEKWAFWQERSSEWAGWTAWKANTVDECSSGAQSGYHLQLCKARAQAPVLLYLALPCRSVHYCTLCKWEHLAWSLFLLKTKSVKW